MLDLCTLTFASTELALAKYGSPFGHNPACGMAMDDAIRTELTASTLIICV